MRFKNLKALFLLFCMLMFSFTTSLSAQGDVTNTQKHSNIYTEWMQLALLGKSQAEIEYYFRSLDEETLGRIKNQIRFTILDNLRRAGLRDKVEKSFDKDDINVVVSKVLIEIRYMGLELDEDLRQSIKEEFGVQLERL